MMEKKMGLLEKVVISVGDKLEKMAVGFFCRIPVIYEPELPVEIIEELNTAE